MKVSGVPLWNMDWKPCFGEFKQEAVQIENDFIISDKITLFDSIAALEMMDAKMDHYSCLQSKKEPIQNEDNAISLFLHFLCGQSLTTCYYPHPNLYTVALKLKTFGLYEEEEIISHDCQVITQYGSSYDSHSKLNSLSSDIYSMLDLKEPPKFHYSIYPTDIRSAIHWYLWASKPTTVKGNIPLDPPTPHLPDMLSTPPRPLHLIPNEIIQDVYKFIYLYYADIYHKIKSFNPIGFNIYWCNFINTIGSAYFDALSTMLFQAFGITTEQHIKKNHVPLDVLQSIRHHLLLKDQQVAKIPFQDFLLLQFKSITKSMAVHSKEEIEALGNGQVSEWPAPHLHDFLNQLMPGFNVLFSDIIHANQHNPGRVRRLINTFIESLARIPFHQYDLILSKLTKDDHKTPYLGFGVQLMTLMGLFQWLIIGYSLQLYESFDLLAYSIQMDYISKSFLKCLEKQSGLAEHQKNYSQHLCQQIALNKPVNVLDLNNFDGLFVKVYHEYYTAFARLLIYHDVSTKVPYELDLYDDTFYANRYQKQFRVLFIAQFPPRLDYAHYTRKMHAFKKMEKKDLYKDIKQHFNKCIDVINKIQTREDDLKDWDIFTKHVMADLLEMAKKNCLLNIESLNKKKVELVQARHFPCFQ